MSKILLATWPASSPRGIVGENNELDANVDDGRGAGAEKAAVVARELYRGGGLEAVAGEGGPRSHEVDGARGVAGDVVHRRADHDSTLDQAHLGVSFVKKARRRF